MNPAELETIVAVLGIALAIAVAIAIALWLNRKDQADERVCEPTIHTYPLYTMRRAACTACASTKPEVAVYVPRFHMADIFGPATIWEEHVNWICPSCGFTRPTQPTVNSELASANCRRE